MSFYCVFITFIIISNWFFCSMICFPYIIVPTIFIGAFTMINEITFVKKLVLFFTRNFEDKFLRGYVSNLLMLFSRDFFCFFVFVINLLPFVPPYGNIICILCFCLSPRFTSLLLSLFCSFFLTILCARFLEYWFVSVNTIFKYIYSFNKVSLELRIFARLSRFHSFPISSLMEHVHSNWYWCWYLFLFDTLFSICLLSIRVIRASRNAIVLFFV